MLFLIVLPTQHHEYRIGKGFVYLVPTNQYNLLWDKLLDHKLIKTDKQTYLRTETKAQNQEKGRTSLEIQSFGIQSETRKNMPEFNHFLGHAVYLY